MQYRTEETNVYNPHHYRHGDMECIDVNRLLPFNLGNAVKYVWRAGYKSDQSEDLNKALWYINDWLLNPRVAIESPYPPGTTRRHRIIYLLLNGHEGLAKVMIDDVLQDRAGLDDAMPYG